MSMQEQYLKLWQQKRDDSPVDSLPENDWAAMQQLLDVEMPVIHANPNLNAGTHDGGASSSAGGSNLGAQITHFIQAKLFYIAAAVITSAVVTYTVVKQTDSTKDKKPAKTEFRADSLHKDSADNQYQQDSIPQENVSTGTNANNGVLPGSANKENIANNNKNINDAPNHEKTATNNNVGTDKKLALSEISGNNKTNNTGNSLGTNKLTAKGGNNPRVPSSSNNVNHRGVLNSNRGNARSGSRTTTPNNGRQAANNNRGFNSGGKFNGNSNKQLNNSGKQQQSAGKSNTNNQPDITIGTISSNFQKYISLQSPGATSFIFVGDDALPINNYNAAMIDRLAKTNATNPANRSLFSNTMPPKDKSAQVKDEKQEKIKPYKAPKIRDGNYNGPDWGILAGVSVPGSFAPKAQNNNFYGSLPVDLFTGAFVTGNINDKWAVDLQIKLLVPNKANENYDHTYTTKNDTGSIVHNTLRINEYRKIYSAQIPLHAVYNISPGISLKAGPVVNIPLKYYRLSAITTTSAFTDTAGYIGKLMDTLNAVQYDTKLSFGVSGGLSYTYKRLRVEATYYFSPQQIKVSSPLSTYRKNANNLQITLGFQLNKTKPK